MKLDKRALDQIAQDIEIDLQKETGPVSTEEAHAIREEVESVIQSYFTYLGAENKVATVESLTAARDVLASIHDATGKARRALMASTTDANKDLASVLDAFLRNIRAQAEQHFERLN